MADLESPAPVETEKGGAPLHDRSNRPTAPAPTRVELWNRWVPWIVAAAMALGMVALTFQTRASWESHRDWVVPVTVPLLVIGGLAFGLLLARWEWNPLLPAIVLVVGILVLTGMDIWLDAEEKEDGLRDMLAVSNGVLLGAVVVASLAALVWVEWKRPARPPATEV